MTVTNNKQNSRNLFSRFKRGQAWKEYAGYHVGDIHESQPVAIPAGSTVVGNVLAPQIMVLGLLSGTAVGRDVVVSSGGAVWGDVYAIRFQLESGGKARGWVNSLTDSEFDNLLSTATPSTPSLDNGDAPAGLKPEHKKILDRDRLDALRQLQTETAVALAARTELEESFDQRLSEMAGEATNQLALLREELKLTKDALKTVHQEADETAETLQTRDSQFKRQSEELASTQDLLSQTTDALDKLQLSHAEKEEALAEIQSAKAGADTHLEEALNYVDTLTGRVHNIETALQASLIHTSDQEDALLRWQELAEINEKKSEELQTELDKAARQIQENNDIIAMLRDQRKQLEKEWGEAQARADKLEAQVSTEDETIQSLIAQQSTLQKKAEAAEQANQPLIAELTQLKNQLALRQEEVADARLHYKKLHVRWKKTNAQLEAVQKQPTKLLSSEQLDEASQKLRESEERVEQLREQTLWNQTSLETAQTELTQIRGLLTERDQQVQQLQAEYGSHQEQFVRQTAEIKTLRKTLHAQEKQAAQDHTQLKESLRLQRAQLDASEKELAHYLNATAKQGERLAEIQATLVERDIQLQETKQIVAKQQKFIKQMQQVTKKRLRDLQEKLAAAQKV